MNGEASAIGAIGAVYKSLGEYSKARNCFERSLTIRRNLGGVEGEGVTLGNIGSVYASLGQHEKALHFFEESLAIRKKAGDVQGESITLGNMANLYAAMGRHDDAESSLKQGIEIQYRLGMPARELENDLANPFLDVNATAKAAPLIYETGYNSSLGRLALTKFDYSSALKHYDADKQEAEKTGNTDALFRSYSGLATAFEGAQNYEMAAKYYENAIKLLEGICSHLLPAERPDFMEVRIGGFARSDPAIGLVRVKTKLDQSRASVHYNSIAASSTFGVQPFPNVAAEVTSQKLEKEQSFVNKIAARRIECKTKHRTKLILHVIDVAYPKPLRLVKDMTDSDIKYLFEWRIKYKDFVWIPEDAKVEVTERGKTISMVQPAFTFGIDD